MEPVDPRPGTGLVGTGLVDIGLVDVDLATGAVTCDAATVELLGLPVAPTSLRRDLLVGAVHPADLDGVSDALAAAAAGPGDFAVRFRDARGDPLRAKGRVIADAQGVIARVVVALAADDESRTGAQDRDEAVEDVLASMAIGYLTVDASWAVTGVNSEGERILGRTAAELLHQDVWTSLPHLVDTELGDTLRTVVADGGTVAFDAFHEPWNAWFEIRCTGTDGGGGAVYFLDVTARHRAQQVSDQGLERSALLAAVAGELADNLDAEVALVNVIKMLVPLFADWGIVSTLGEENGKHWRDRLRDIGSWHPDPELHALVEQYRRIRVAALTEASPVGEALRTNRPATVSGAGRTPPGLLLAAGAAHDLLVRLAPHATVVLPLRGRGATRGLLTLVNGTDRGGFSAEDIATLEEVTSQLGLALDNIRLHAAQRSLSEELQQSLLTDLPEPDHLHLVARYVPASNTDQIGGDWYDAFLVRDGSTCLVVGDVTGHDRGAAVAMAQMRNVLRGVAHAVVQPPAAILGSLDLALHDLAVGSLGTAVLAKVTQPEAEAAIGVRQLHWANAGHLPPLLVHADGRAEFLERSHDLMLGLLAHVERSDHVVDLEPEATIVLYTDGLVERRGEHLDAGLERLRRTAERLHGRPLQEFCDGLVDGLAPDSEDDVAVLVVRADREDRPRPPEAGPERLPADLTADTPADIPAGPPSGSADTSTNR